MFSPLFITGKNTVDVYNPYAWGSVKLLPVIFNPNHRSKFLVKLTSSSMAIHLPYAFIKKKSSNHKILIGMILINCWLKPYIICGFGEDVNNIITAGTEAQTIMVRIISQTAVIFSAISYIDSSRYIN